MVTDAGRHVHVRLGVRCQPGAGAALPDHEGLQNRGKDPVVQLADNRFPVAVHVLRGTGHILHVPGLRPDQVGILPGLAFGSATTLLIRCFRSRVFVCIQGRQNR